MDSIKGTYILIFNADIYASIIAVLCVLQILGALQGTNGVLGPTTGHAQSFRPSLGVPSATLHAASEVKYIADHYCCFKCVPKSRVRKKYKQKKCIKANIILVVFLYFDSVHVLVCIGGFQCA